MLQDTKNGQEKKKKTKNIRHAHVECTQNDAAEKLFVYMCVCVCVCAGVHASETICRCVQRMHMYRGY